MSNLQSIIDQAMGTVKFWDDASKWVIEHNLQFSTKYWSDEHKVLFKLTFSKDVPEHIIDMRLTNHNSFYNEYQQLN